jgi:putative FmdB family regulatory protein
MPVYEYQCKACGRDFEYQQRMVDPDKTTCEACGGALERLISRTAFSLKGGGWYKDLYASPKPDAGSSDSGGGIKSESKASASPVGKTETAAASAAVDKPAAKPSSDSGGSSGSSSAGSAGPVTKAS